MNPADAPIMILAMISDTLPSPQIYDYGDTIIAQRLSQVEGVKQVLLRSRPTRSKRRIWASSSITNTVSVFWAALFTALAAINCATQSLEERFDIKIALFTLLSGSVDYEDIAGPMPLPGLVPIVKTGARELISGELTEKKIVDSFMGAMARGGGCPLGDPSGN